MTKSTKTATAKPAPNRRIVLSGMAAGAGAAAGALDSLVTPVQAQTSPKTFVLVHGSWHGGWCWRRVADRLESKGHKVYTPTLTGVGERAHLMSAMITLDTHIIDVANVIKWENLDNVVLVGHSYAGFVISGVAEKAQSAIRSIVYLDAFLPENGDRVVDYSPPDMRESSFAAAAKNDVGPSGAACQGLRRQREGPGLGQQQDDAAADLRVAAADRAHRRPRKDREEDLHPRRRVPRAGVRQVPRQAENRFELADL